MEREKEREREGKKRERGEICAGSAARCRPRAAPITRARARGRWGTRGASGQAAPGCMRQGGGKRKRDSLRRSRRALRKKRECKVRSAKKKKVESTNGTGSWESGVRDREKIFRI